VRENAQSLREYETIYVLRPDLEDQVAIDLIQKMKGALEKQGGTHIKLSNWGRKKLAWECDRH
jgi:small subunit ribosomal protein S6